MKAILGGAFNPIHKGHIQMAEAVLKSGYADEVILMPCYSHSFGKKMACTLDRLRMCMRCVTPQIKLNSFEIDNHLDGRTLVLVQALELENWQDYCMIIGADNAACFPKWYHHEELMRKVNFIVVPREGSIINKEIKKTFKAPHQILTEGVAPYSSTSIRQHLDGWWETGANEKELNEQLSPDVFEYIKAHKLYTNSK